MRRFLMRKLAWVAALSLLPPPYALAQDEAVVGVRGSAAPSTAAQRTFSQQELDELLAPIALYPDPLLAQVLMAATYPLEVVEAARWVRAHPGLEGDRLEFALREQTWDPSVKGLVTVPQVLTMMDEKLDWTEKLGDAFLEQQQAVMDTVQTLRARAQAAGNLVSTPQQTVTTEGGAIGIAPVYPDVIYVPVYDPAVIYGPWWWPAPPYYWYPPGYVVTGPFIYFGVGVIVGPAIWGGCDWGHRTVVVNVRDYNSFNQTRITNPHWAHDTYHRKGVPYRDNAVRREYRRELPGSEARHAFRGFETPNQYHQAPRQGGGETREEFSRHGTRSPERPAAAEPRAIPRAVPAVPATPPAAHRIPDAGQRVAPAPGVPQHAAPQHLAPQRMAPQHVAPQHLAPQRMAPQHVAPQHAPSLEQRNPPSPRAARQPSAPARHEPPAFETFGRGDAARVYSDRGAASRGAQTHSHPAPTQGARPRAGATPGARPQGTRPPQR